MVTCMSFSASANVAGVTTGPEPAPVPNVGGAPGVAGGVGEGVCDSALSGERKAAVATSTPSGARIRNWRRVFIGEEAYSAQRSQARWITLSAPRVVFDLVSSLPQNLSFTPGFSRVEWRRCGLGNRLNGFYEMLRCVTHG